MKFKLLTLMILILSVFTLSECRQTPPKTLTGAVKLTEKIAHEVFDEESGYSQVRGLYDQRIGLIATGVFSGSINPMKKDKIWDEDFKKDLEFVRRAAATGLLSPNLKVVVSFRNPVGEYVRIWYGSHIAEIKDFPEEAKNLASNSVTAEEGKRMFFYNGIANGLGGYPEWSPVFEWKEAIMENLRTEGYKASGFILPAFGPVFIVEKDTIDKARMRKLHADFYHGLHSAAQFYPRVLLNAREKEKFVTIIHDVSAEDPSTYDTTVYPASE